MNASTNSVHARIQPTPQQSERQARRFWVSLIVGMLGLQVAIGITAVVLSVSDPSVAIIPNYYQSAVNWDTTRRARELTGKLGWQLEPGVGAVGGEHRPVSVRILNRQGSPVQGVRVSAKVFHHARGSEIHQVQLSEVRTGYYEGNTSLLQSGVWQLELRIEGDHGIAAESREILVN